MTRLESQADWGIDAEWLINGLQDRGITIEQMSAALSTGFNLKSSHYLPIDAYVTLFGWGAHYLSRPHLGLELAAGLDTSDLGIYGYLIDNSPTVSALMEAAEHYQSIFMRGMGWNMKEIGPSCEIQWRIFRPDSVGTRQDIEFTLGAMVEILHRKTGRQFHLEGVSFAHPPTEPVQTYRDFFDCEVLFEQATNSLLLDRAYLEVALNDTDPKLLRVLKQQADALLEKWKSEASVVDKARFLIATSLEDEEGGVEKLSQQLHVTSRTLNRWLSRAGTNYKGLREEVILDAAKQALSRSDASITLIASKLGYSESSAFVRAFKRMTSQTPSAYRKTYASH
jgi:AraC-like DNA-binding protein